MDPGAKLEKKKKRVRFEEPEDDGSDDDVEGDPSKRRQLLPEDFVDKKAVDAEFVDEECGPVKATDPRLAAKRRAEARKAAKAKGGNHDDDDETDLGDVSRAEEDYDEPEEEENEEGVKFEPFHLRREREEGFFDEDGNYVEYRIEKDSRDAWLEGVQVDEELAERLAKRAQTREEEEEDAKDLSRCDVAKLKRQMADIMRPEETVMAALRRLGGAGGGSGGGGRGRGGGGKTSGDQGQRGGKTRPPGRQFQSESDRQAFDVLTESAALLLDNGDYDVYQETRETLDREAQGYEAILRMQLKDVAGEVKGGASTSQQSGQKEEGEGKVADIFADDGEDEAAPGPSSETTTAANEAGQKADSLMTDAPGAASGVNEVNDESMAAAGYIKDATSGLYYNSEHGFFYEPSMGLYGNPANGIWYRFDSATGQYEEVKGEEGNAEGAGAGTTEAAAVGSEGQALPQAQPQASAA